MFIIYLSFFNAQYMCKLNLFNFIIPIKLVDWNDYTYTAFIPPQLSLINFTIDYYNYVSGSPTVLPIHFLLYFPHCLVEVLRVKPSNCE